MIFMMSKRVYLNHMCQLMNKEVLLNANYYIADTFSPDRVRDNIEPEDEFEFVNGEWVQKPKKEQIKKATSLYNIQYGSGCINPGPFVTTLLQDNGDEFTLEQRMYETLFQYHNMKSIYDEIYRPERLGNGILFILFFDDDNVRDFGHIIASHLARNFGEDIAFVDPGLRPNVRGQNMYPGGDPAFVKRMLQDLNDRTMVDDIVRAASQSQDAESSVSNLTTHLYKYNTPELIHLHDLLWPDDPLPRNNYYTGDEVKELIVQRMIEQTGRIRMQDQQQNRLNVLEVYSPGGY